MGDIDFKCTWKLNDEGNGQMKLGRVVICNSDPSTSGRCQLFLNVKTRGPKQTLRLDEITDVVHRSPILKVSFTTGVTVTVKEEPNLQNDSKMYDLVNLLNVFKVSNHALLQQPNSPKRKALKDTSSNKYLPGKLFMSPVAAQSADQTSPILSTLTTDQMTLGRPVSGKRVNDIGFSSLGSTSTPIRFFSWSERQPMSVKKSSEPDLVEAKNQSCGARKRLSKDMYADTSEFHDVGEPSIKHSTPSSRFLRTTPPHFGRKPGFLSSCSAISNRTKMIMMNSSQLKIDNKDGRKNEKLVEVNGTSTLNERQPTLLRGFNNLGNTCYMNSILQSLFNLVAFSTDLLNCTCALSLQVSDDATTDTTLFRAMVDLVRSQLHVQELIDSRDVMLANVKRAISSSARRFSGHQQHDAHEFLCQLLDQLKEEVSLWSTKSTDASALCTNPTVSNFEFTIQTKLRCDRCGHTVVKDELYHDLSVDYPRRRLSNCDSTSIQDAIDAYFQSDTIDFTCDLCRNKTATLTHKFLKLPRVLIVHLKRYSFNTSLGRHRKDRRKIFIPKYLTLQDQCRADTSPAPSLPKPHGAFKNISLLSTKDKSLLRLPMATDVDEGKFQLLPDEPSIEPGKLSSHTKLEDSSEFVGFNLENVTEEEQIQMALDESRKLVDRDDKENDLPPLKTNSERVADSDRAGNFDGLNQIKTFEDEDDFEKACRLSLMDFDSQHHNGSIVASISDEEEVIVAHLDQGEKYEETRKNAETGLLPFSYKLCSVVSHLGDSSFAGHYISDAYDVTKSRWLTFDDSSVSATTEDEVRKQRNTTGNIFFYCCRDLIDDLEGFFDDRTSIQQTYTFKKLN